MQIGIATFITDEGIGPADLGRALEDRAFDSLFITEHSHILVSRETPYVFGEGDMPRVFYRTLDPFVALTAAAVATTKMVLATGSHSFHSGTSSTPPSRSPVSTWRRADGSCSGWAPAGTWRRCAATARILAPEALGSTRAWRR